MRFNCNDIEIIMDGLNDYRGLCEYDEESWEKITKVMDKVRVYAVSYTHLTLPTICSV